MHVYVYIHKTIYVQSLFSEILKSETIDLPNRYSNGVMKFRRTRSKKAFTNVQNLMYKLSLQNVRILYLTLPSSIILTLSKSFFLSSLLSTFIQMVVLRIER